MKYEEMVMQYSDLVEYLRNNGLDDNKIYNFIITNKVFIDNYRELIPDGLFLIFNGKKLYCILYINDNSFYWSTYSDNKFSGFISNEDDSNLVVDMVIGFSDSKKLQSVDSNLKDKNLEDRMKELRKIKLNDKGYHLK